VLLIAPAFTAGVAAMFGYEILLQTPWWANTLFLIGALWLIRILAIAPYQLWAKERGRAQKAEADLVSVKAGPSQSRPDWKISDLSVMLTRPCRGKTAPRDGSTSAERSWTNWPLANLMLGDASMPEGLPRSAPFAETTGKMLSGLTFSLPEIQAPWMSNLLGTLSAMNPTETSK
jgi:hypothetical protein